MAPIVSGSTGRPGLLRSLPNRPILMNDFPTRGISISVAKYPAIPNPMAATKYSSQLGQLKDMVVTLPDNIITIANIGDKLYGLASANGIKFVAPTDSKQAPKESGK